MSLTFRSAVFALSVATLSVSALSVSPLAAPDDPGQPQNGNGAARVITGAEDLVATDFAALAGARLGLITNQTGLVQGRHLADLIHESSAVELVAVFAPEHGFRGTVEAGEKVRDGRDPRTGVTVHSLYGATRKPTQRMLRGVDMLVFDVQDIGARFYTYISTMGLAMEAAAEAGIPFVVLDRPNPLGGRDVAGFVLEPARKTFVGQYPIPIVHGMTVAELAIMIKTERWMKGLENLDLRIGKMVGWKRDMRWPDTGLPWTWTSPNIPTFRSALVYPGIGIIGDTQLVNEGRGTPEPFTRFGAPWLNATRMAQRLNALSLPGVEFKPVTYTPRSIPNVATNPLYVGQRVNGVEIAIRNTAAYLPLDVGIHAVALLVAEARRQGITPLIKNRAMFYAISGTKRLYRMLMNGASGTAIVRAWKTEVDAFKQKAKAYHLYN
ncbi:MAG: DUF1343 domain-containing protein [Pseudomonadota bacterium]